MAQNGNLSSVSLSQGICGYNRIVLPPVGECESELIIEL